MKKLSLLVFVMMVTWIVAGCTPRLDSNGCYGYTYDPGLKRGTLLKNRKYVTPYRQCVEKEAPHKDLERRPNG
tara:strand:+ start:274 stop:492 length:219 start_codon:yes stop_codon:yes gene_type:complete